jgi:hypothetical protein
LGKTKHSRLITPFLVENGTSGEHYFGINTPPQSAALPRHLQAKVCGSPTDLRLSGDRVVSCGMLAFCALYHDCSEKLKARHFCAVS